MKFKYDIIASKYKVIDDHEEFYQIYSLKENLIGHEKLYFNYLALVSIEHDVMYAEAYLNQMFYGESTSLIDGALINSAIQILVKCFTNPQNKGRYQLDSYEVFETYAKKRGLNSFMKQFNQFKIARNKTIVHDENDYKDNLIGITIDNRCNTPVEIALVRVKKKFLYKENAELLKQMFELTREFICEKKEHMEKMIIDIIIKNIELETFTFKPLDVENVIIENKW